ncbi:19466_t:CDS:2 [Dentiscutata erythropus]|uniref:19466_t:CDS:1 n=1 Tax=Dentiscutata erythropus TaxID=1348616 RepID=A0A9N9E948_9GLOM|nr:19466_t:CDS:2 [Dentiscutata erythropus]
MPQFNIAFFELRQYRYLVMIYEDDTKVAIVTGGNNGLGFITVRELVRKNAHVFIASRSKEKVFKKDKNVQYGINNAGIMATAFETTQDGIQDQFGVNHLGHFLFTILLLPTIKASAPSRIVNISSVAHEKAPPAGIEFDKLNDPKAHSAFQRYGQSKLANILFTIELDKRLSGTNVYCNSLHPGVIKTELWNGFVSSWGSWIKPFLYIGTSFMLTPEEGALTQLYCATSPEIEEKNLHAKYFVPYGKLGKPTAQAKNEELAKQLWDFSEKLVKEKLGDDVFNNVG